MHVVDALHGKHQYLFVVFSCKLVNDLPLAYL